MGRISLEGWGRYMKTPFFFLLLPERCSSSHSSLSSARLKFMFLSLASRSSRPRVTLTMSNESLSMRSLVSSTSNSISSCDSLQLHAPYPRRAGTNPPPGPRGAPRPAFRRALRAQLIRGTWLGGSTANGACAINFRSPGERRLLRAHPRPQELFARAVLRKVHFAGDFWIATGILGGASESETSLVVCGFGASGASSTPCGASGAVPAPSAPFFFSFFLLFFFLFPRCEHEKSAPFPTREGSGK